MADIRINQLPEELAPSASDNLAIDGATTRRTTIQAAVEIGRPAASQAEAEAGVNATKVMTPLTVKQSIAVNAASPAQGAKADSALQPSAIGVSVQAYSANLGTLSGVSPGAAGLAILADVLPTDVRTYIDAAPADFVWRVPLEAYGAVGDGTTDDTAAINTALGAGVPLTGSKRIYGVTGKISLPAGASLWDATFKQLAPGASLSVITLEGNAVDGLDLRRVKVDRNGDGTNGGLLNGSGTNGALNSAFGMAFIGCSDCHFEELEVFGDDSGTGILFRQIGESSRIIAPYVHDMDWARTAATDDQVQGIWFDQCTNIEVVAPKAINLKGVLNSVPSRRFTRGIALGGNDSIRLLYGYVETVDQGIDITGTTGGPNFDIRVDTSIVKDCYTWGIKLANTARRCVVSKCVAEDCGAAGFVVSGNGAVSVTITSDRNTFHLCTAKNTGSNGQTVYATIAGFNVLSDGTEAGSGARTKFVRCRAVDTQAVPTMQYGFVSSITSASYQAVGEDIESIGHTTAATNGYIFRIGVVGTVAETSGRATGDIIERGSNGNGAYVKFADGTMICTHSVDFTATAISTAAGSLFTTAAASTWTFPAAFLAGSEPVTTPIYIRNDGAVVGGAYTRTGSNTSVNYQPWTSASVGAGNAKLVKLSAVGRWV